MLEPKSLLCYRAIPEFCEGQIEDLERSIFNYVISMFEEDKIDSVWEQLRRFIGGRLWN
jgi:hypothetical protein